MSAPKKRLIWISVVLLSLILVFAVASQFIAIHIGLFDTAGGSCCSVVFDKNQVMGADKIVYRVGDQVITITDPDTVKKITENFVVANRAGLCPSQDDKWMYIYNGDKLVRCLQWRCCEEIVDVYQADGSHWLLPGECKTGQVELTEEFMDFLDSLMASD